MFIIKACEAGKMAVWLRALAVLSEDHSLVLSIRVGELTTTCNSNPKDS